MSDNGDFEAQLRSRLRDLVDDESPSPLLKKRIERGLGVSLSHESPPRRRWLVSAVAAAAVIVAALGVVSLAGSSPHHGLKAASGAPPVTQHPKVQVYGETFPTSPSTTAPAAPAAPSPPPPPASVTLAATGLRHGWDLTALGMLLVACGSLLVCVGRQAWPMAFRRLGFHVPWAAR